MHYTIHLVFEQGYFRTLHALPFHLVEGQTIQAVFTMPEKRTEDAQALLTEINRALDEIGVDESNDIYLAKMGAFLRIG